MPQRSKKSLLPARRQRPRKRSAKRNGAPERGLLLLLAAAGILLLVVATLLPTPHELNVAEPMTVAQARASNASVSIQTDRLVSAEAFYFRGGRAAREQAAECLATAGLYEAGDDGRGQRAVMQVILNRLRAPGFPATICGVVYQGSGRPAGCQFSFTCDGSLQRRPVHVGWSLAKRAARRALAGAVFVDVGKATHYHADWIVPYWRNSMTKVAQVGPHLFYIRKVG
ncbi:cell wall hydrolase [Sphingomonas sp. GC_Shp_3]|uniref:cell wall hydrolase n=1 Tax=Sphingomonas sp. GC_Shp_3 TaxID=2937383 RepID=UPI00226A4A4F